MVIQIDKEAEKVLMELLDGYTKFAGVRGVQTVNTVMRSIKLLPEVQDNTSIENAKLEKVDSTSEEVKN